MKTKIAVALIINACVVSPTIAGDIYRWTDPNTGKLTTSPSLPTYPIKESRIAGQLPNGNVIEVILDSNAPEVKAIVEKRKVREAEERRITEEKQKEKLVREAEERKITEKEQEDRKRIAAQKAKEDAEYKEKYWKQRDAEREEESRKTAALRLAAKDYKENYKTTTSAGNPACQVSESQARADLAASLDAKYPNSYSTQKMLLDSGMEKFRLLCSIPSDSVSDGILKKLNDRYYPSFGTIHMLYESNMKSYKELHK